MEAMCLRYEQRVDWQVGNSLFREGFRVEVSLIPVSDNRFAL